jgi:hypothetical protein
MGKYSSKKSNNSACEKLIEFIQQLRDLDVPLTDSGINKYRNIVRNHELLDAKDTDLRTEVLLQAQKLGSHNAVNFLKRSRLSASVEEQSIATEALIKYDLGNESGENILSILKVKTKEDLDNKQCLQTTVSATIDLYESFQESVLILAFFYSSKIQLR